VLLSYALPPGTKTFSDKAAREPWAKGNIASAVFAQLNQPLVRTHFLKVFHGCYFLPCYLFCYWLWFLPAPALAALVFGWL
jgi:hypothetical protein